ncbi:MAG: hypothetical protein U0T74_14425 [Chitinophagales bacterium]
MMNLSISITERGKTLILKVKGGFRNNNWATDFGLFQNKVASNTFFKIEVDLRDCTWSDPLPMLSLLLTCYGVDEKNIAFHLPKESDDEISQRFLKFFFLEGFYDSVSQCKWVDFYVGEAKVTLETIKRIKEIKTELVYTKCNLIQAQIEDSLVLDDEGDTSLEIWINDRIKIARNRLTGEIPMSVLDSLLYKLKLFLGETIHNVKKHAYEQLKFKKKPFAIYARLRYGLDANSLGQVQKEKLHKMIKGVDGEARNCPLLDYEFVESNFAFIEVFVIDSGIGIVKSLKEFSLNTPTPLKNCWSAIFEHGKRRVISGKDQTKYGGLYYLGNIFRNNHDFIVAKADNEWVGGYFTDSMNISDIKFEKSLTELPSVGQAWIGRFRVPNPDEAIEIENFSITGERNVSNNWKTWTRNALNNPVYESLCNNTPTILKSVYIFDNRFKKVSPYILPDKEGSKPENVFLFPTSNPSKIFVWKQINRLWEEMMKESITPTTLFILDIPVLDKASYTYALDNASIINNNKEWAKCFEQIYLVTNLLQVVIFKRVGNYDDGYSYQMESNELHDMFICLTSKSDTKFIDIKDLFGIVKVHDSNVFWDKLNEGNKIDRYYIDGSIKWNTELSQLNGYLNFTATLSQPDVIRLYRILLARSVGLFPTKKAHFNNVDPLTKKLCNEANILFDTNLIKKQNVLNLGSVFVTGYKENDLKLGANYYEQNALNINFILHADSANQSAPAWLIWHQPISSSDKATKVTELERIGKTHHIAKYGYKFFKIPRFNSDKKSFYYRTPSETYEDIQSNDITTIKLGNYDYGSSFDLIKIDIEKCAMHSFQFDGELAYYLVTEFMKFLNIRRIDQLNLSIHSGLHARIRKEIVSIVDDSDFYNNIGILVYPEYYVNSMIIEQVLNIIPLEYHEKIIPISYFKDTRSNATVLMSPHSILEVSQKLGKLEEGRKGVVFFDSTVISGRTRKEMKHILLGIGASEVKTLTILDRSRFPLSLPSKNSFRGYWRIDIPHLSGSNAINPINDVLDRIVEINGSIIDEEVKKRVTEWCDNWYSITPTEDHFQYGTRGVGINPIIKRFGISPEPPHDDLGDKDTSKVRLRNSLAVSLFLSEIHCMTGREDIADSFLKSNKSLTPDAQIEILCAQLLLFKNEFTNETNINLLTALIRAVASIKSVSNYTALACIVLLTQKRDTLLFLLKKLPEIQDSWLLLNDDINLLFAYITYYYSDKAPKPIQRIGNYLMTLSNNDSLSDIYIQFHNECFKDGVSHSCPIYDVFNDSQRFMTSELGIKLRWAKLSCLKIKNYLTNYIALDFYRSFSINIDKNTDDHIVIDAQLNKVDNVSLLIDELKVNLQKSVSKIDAVFTANKQSVNLVPNEIMGLRNNLRITHSGLMKIHNLLFIPANNPIWPQRMQPIIEDITNNILPVFTAEKWIATINEKKDTGFCRESNPIISISKYRDSKELPKRPVSGCYWTFYDRKVRIFIENYISNAVRSTCDILDPWSDLNSETKGSMWVRQNYSDDKIFLNIEFANAYEDDIETVRSRFLGKLREEKNHLKKVGVKYDFFEEEKQNYKILIFQIKFPMF